MSFILFVTYVNCSVERFDEIDLRFRVLCHIFTNKYILERYFLQAVLETIRDLMNTECIVPDWLHDIFLGYDDPGAAHYSRYINIT